MCSILGFCGKDGDFNDINNALRKTHSRGPDASRVVWTGNGWLGFNRLSIMGLTEEGMQPFAYGNHSSCSFSNMKISENQYQAPPESELLLVCNGEIYGFRSLKEELIQKGYHFLSDSDCEILPALYRECGTEMFKMLDAEYALILYDIAEDTYIAARDPIGIRPLYYGVREDGTYGWYKSSENMSDNYYSGSISVLKGYEACEHLGITMDKVLTVVANSEGTVGLDDIYCITCSPTYLVSNGIDKSDTLGGNSYDLLFVVTGEKSAQATNMGNYDTYFFTKIK